jgi:hypothetical protein
MAHHIALLDWRSTKPQSCDDSKSNGPVEDSVQDWDCDHPETRPVSERPRWAQKAGKLVTDEGCPSTILRVKQEHLSEAAQNGYQKPCDARVNDRLSICMQLLLWMAVLSNRRE